MRAILWLILFILLSFAAASKECDYKVEISKVSQKGNTIGWGVESQKLSGSNANVTMLVSVIADDGRIIKKFPNAAVQKDALKYSMSLEPGTYYIKTSLQADCQDINMTNNAASSKILVDLKKKEVSEMIFTSSDEKMKYFAIYLLLAVSIMLNIILIWKR